MTRDSDHCLGRFNFIVICLIIIYGVIFGAVYLDSLSSGDPVKPDYHVVNATMTNIAYKDGDRLTADFSFTLAAATPNKNKTFDFTNSTEATALYFAKAVVASSTTLPVPSPLRLGSSDNLFTFGLHAQDAPLYARDSGSASLEVKLMARSDEKSTYALLKVVCRGLKYSPQDIEVTKDNKCS